MVSWRAATDKTRIQSVPQPKAETAGEQRPGLAPGLWASGFPALVGVSKVRAAMPSQHAVSGVEGERGMWRRDWRLLDLTTFCRSSPSDDSKVIYAGPEISARRTAASIAQAGE